jgi:hypothetical protein
MRVTDAEPAATPMKRAFIQCVQSWIAPLTHLQCKAKVGQIKYGVECYFFVAISARTRASTCR